ncbi:wax ester/triacylglycerol synthase family O-acyltransferase [Hoyosella sp. YIM 151337]|uniref:WS/DGAT/MGAT family O-acyltransferase n=1 Tax=Hoyosella sp. YIM 151337 TaxID=2992742 RepID=UPI002236B129|nr:wax ester/triacylglycerol synthase family O-acyltransferase [Hoyosella sp. YIM 151337]MCW4355912.1 wax ester/triacylglycerol synthase family O-acyltransferase [Hoyosella sp. YIM 151337]
MRLINPVDYFFLALEGRERPLHVGGLQLFTPPAGAGPDFARELYTKLVSAEAVSTRFRQTLGSVSARPKALSWRDDKNIDLDYHVRLSALPRPGRIRELLEVTSRWHSSLLDRHRPLWEIHVVEGLRDGRLAVYTKMHHALADGVTALKLMQSSLSEDPGVTGVPPLFAPHKRHRDEDAGRGPFGALKVAAGMGMEAVGLTRATAEIGWQIARERDMPLPLRAPRSMFNVPIGGARRFAAQSWRIERVRAVANALDCTLNDAVLGMCGGALRAFLLEQQALPDAPLVAFVPVSLHGRGSGDASNSVAAVLANLGTDTADPLQRMQAVTASMRQAKQMMSGLTPLQAMAVSAAMLAPFATSSVTRAVGAVPPTFNVVISHVPGPTRAMYWDGAKLDGVYPASIVMDGAALNITLTRTADTLDFGIIGCRTAVPHVQRLLIHLETALAELENALGLGVPLHQPCASLRC